MIFEAWRFSAQQAWRQPVLRTITIATASLVFIGSGIFLWKMIPAARHHDGTLIVHYNVYLGIDQIRGWSWALLLPIAWFIITATDFLLAFGLYRLDSSFAISLCALALLWSVPWAFGLFYLTRLNG